MSLTTWIGSSPILTNLLDIGGFAEIPLNIVQLFGNTLKQSIILPLEVLHLSATFFAPLVIGQGVAEVVIETICCPDVFIYLTLFFDFLDRSYFALDSISLSALFLNVVIAFFKFIVVFVDFEEVLSDYFVFAFELCINRRFL